VQERKHRLIKRFLKDRHHQEGYEMSMMIHVTAQHMHDLQQLSRTSGLVDAKSAPPALEESVRMFRPGARAIQASTVMRTVYGEEYRRGDICLLSAEFNFAAAEIWFHVEVTPPVELLSLVRLCPLSRTGLERPCLSAEYLFDEDADPQFIPLSSIVCAAISRVGDRSLTAIWPLQYRKVCGESAGPSA